jgi:hypothetical protein
MEGRSHCSRFTWLKRFESIAHGKRLRRRRPPCAMLSPGRADQRESPTDEAILTAAHHAFEKPRLSASSGGRFFISGPSREGPHDLRACRHRFAARGWTEAAAGNRSLQSAHDRQPSSKSPEAARLKREHRSPARPHSRPCQLRRCAFLLWPRKLRSVEPLQSADNVFRC